MQSKMKSLMLRILLIIMMMIFALILLFVWICPTEKWYGMIDPDAAFFKVIFFCFVILLSKLFLLIFKGKKVVLITLIIDLFCIFCLTETFNIYAQYIFYMQSK